MTSRLIYNPDPEHRCALTMSGSNGPTDNIRRGAVEVCEECGKAWVYDPIPWERLYRPLHRWPLDREQHVALQAWRRKQ